MNTSVDAQAVRERERERERERDMAMETPPKSQIEASASGSDASLRSDSKKEGVMKPWKQKQLRRSFPNGGALEEIEIFEGKPVLYGHSFLEITPPESGYTRIVTGDDAEFLVPSKVVDCFQCVDVILHGDVVFREKLDKVIRFPDIQAKVMESILRFVFIEHLNTLKAAKYWGHDMPRLVFQFEVEPGQVMDIIYAAHFLGIKSLLRVAATMVAHHLQDVPDVSSMPSDLAWCVAEQLSAQELLDAEERSDFLSLDLDTEMLWEKHCKKCYHLDIVPPVPKSSPYPSYDYWGFGAGPPPTSWKSLFVALQLQHLADRQDGGENETFFKSISYKGKHAFSHTIRPMFWEWVMMGRNSISFPSYATQYPNLLSLNLIKLPLWKLVEDGTIPCLSVGHILNELPLLQHLDISETGFTAEAAVNLSRALQSHRRLQVLRIAFNKIKTEGFAAIAQILPFVKTLKLLDVRENLVDYSVCKAIVSGIKESTLRELLLDENFRCRPEADLSLEVSPSTCSHLAPNDNVDLDESWSKTGDVMKLQVPLLSAMPPNLHVLNLQNCGITDTRIQTLVQALTEHVSIEKLDLTENNITSEGATAIFTWLQTNASLVELCLANNNISESCSAVISRSIHKHASIEKLSLRGNYTYGEDHLLEVIHAGIARGGTMMATNGRKFMLDLRQTNIFYLTRARVQNQITDISNLILLM